MWASNWKDCKYEKSISNAFENINQLEIENKNLKKLNYFKKEFLRSLSIAYIYNTFSILRGNQLSLTSKENNQRYIRALEDSSHRYRIG